MNSFRFLVGVSDADQGEGWGLGWLQCFCVKQLSAMRQGDMLAANI